MKKTTIVLVLTVFGFAASAALRSGVWSSAAPLLRGALKSERALLISLTNTDGTTGKVPVAKKGRQASRKAKPHATVAQQ